MTPPDMGGGRGTWGDVGSVPGRAGMCKRENLRSWRQVSNLPIQHRQVGNLPPRPEEQCLSAGVLVSRRPAGYANTGGPHLAFAPAPPGSSMRIGIRSQLLIPLVT